MLQFTLTKLLRYASDPQSTPASCPAAPRSPSPTTGLGQRPNRKETPAKIHDPVIPQRHGLTRAGPSQTRWIESKLMPKKWEYVIIDAKDKPLQALKELGVEGWELVQSEIAHKEITGTAYYLLWFKREIE
jgi:hypothetical protein